MHLFGVKNFVILKQLSESDNADNTLDILENEK